MSSRIAFETINFDDTAQKTRVQFEAKIYNMIGGKQIYANEETGFIFQKYSGFSPKKFNPDPSKRDYIRIGLDPEQESCIKLEETLNEYDNSYELNKKSIFGKYEKLYKFLRSVKEPKKKEEDDLDDDLDDNLVDDEENLNVKKNDEINDKEPKFKTCKMKLKMDWFYYYNDQRLDKSNTYIVKKACTDLMSKNKNLDKEKRKTLLHTLVFNLNFKENDNLIQKSVRFDELEQRREIDTKVFYRKPETIPSNAEEFLKKQRTTAKEIEDFETELVKLFGDPQEPKDIRHPDDLDKFYTYNCWIRILYSPYRVWAAKTKDEDIQLQDGTVIKGKRKSGIKYIVNSIDIIQLPYENNYGSSHKVVYSKYAFGKKLNDELLINQTVDDVFTSVEKVESKIETQVETQVDDKLSKSTKKVMKVESDDEDDKNNEKESEKSEEKSDSEESDSEESEEEESDNSSESEKEIEVKSNKKVTKKTVINNSKSKKSNNKSK